jgi:hypothetical protein
MTLKVHVFFLVVALYSAFFDVKNVNINENVNMKENVNVTTVNQNVTFNQNMSVNQNVTTTAKQTQKEKPKKESTTNVKKTPQVDKKAVASCNFVSDERFTRVTREEIRLIEEARRFERTAVLKKENNLKVTGDATLVDVVDVRVDVPKSLRKFSARQSFRATVWTTASFYEDGSEYHALQLPSSTARSTKYWIDQFKSAGIRSLPVLAPKSSQLAIVGPPREALAQWNARKTLTVNMTLDALFSGEYLAFLEFDRSQWPADFAAGLDLCSSLGALDCANFTASFTVASPYIQKLQKFEPTDTMIIQLSGVEQVFLADESVRLAQMPASHPLHRQLINAEKTVFTDDLLLEPGQMLFIPAGVPHTSKVGVDPSVSIVIQLESLFSRLRRDVLATLDRGIAKHVSPHLDSDDPMGYTAALAFGNALISDLDLDIDFYDCVMARWDWLSSERDSGIETTNSRLSDLLILSSSHMLDDMEALGRKMAAVVNKGVRGLRRETDNDVTVQAAKEDVACDLIDFVIVAQHNQGTIMASIDFKVAAAFTALMAESTCDVD